jgi:prepilin signal peptidase PulO-like enzyme (type II secretory pathway)
MFVPISLLGLVVGWLLHWTADYLPRLSPRRTYPGARVELPSTPAAVRWLRSPRAWKTLRERDHWLGLDLGAELLSAAVFGLLWVWLGLSWNLYAYAGSYAFLLLIAIIDLKYRLVLNVIIYPATAAVVFLGHSTLSLLLGGILAFMLFALTAWLKPGDMGGGDIKLATLMGFAFGFPEVLWALMVGILSGGLVALFLLQTRRGDRQTGMAYAPFLCLGAMVALLFNPFGIMMR